MQDSIITEWTDENAGVVYRVSEKLEDFPTDVHHVEVYDTPAFGRVLRVNGHILTAENDEWIYHENLVHPAALSHPEPKRALVLGGGTGGSARQLLKYDSIERVLIGELDGFLVDTVRQHFEKIHQGAFDDARLEIKLGDANEWINNIEEQFDLIVLDLVGYAEKAEGFYSRAFFERCRALLTDNGVLALSLGSPQRHSGAFVDRHTALQEVFTTVEPYLVPLSLHGGLWGMAIARRNDASGNLTADEVDSRLRSRAVGQLEYYNGAVHAGQQALPNFVAALLAPPTRSR